VTNQISSTESVLKDVLAELKRLTKKHDKLSDRTVRRGEFEMENAKLQNQLDDLAKQVAGLIQRGQPNRYATSPNTFIPKRSATGVIGGHSRRSSGGQLKWLSYGVIFRLGAMVCTLLTALAIPTAIIVLAWCYGQHDGNVSDKQAAAKKLHAEGSLSYDDHGTQEIQAEAKNQSSEAQKH
jgi:hypothetical protein